MAVWCLAAGQVVPQQGLSPTDGDIHETSVQRSVFPAVSPDLLSSTASEACSLSVPSLGVLRHLLLPQGQGSLPRADAARRGFAVPVLSSCIESGSPTKKLP